MNIVVVSQSFFPDTFASNDTVRILVERGHNVTVLTGLPDYTDSVIPEEYKHGKNRIQNYCGARVYRVPTIARRHGPIWRSLNYLSFVVNGNRAVGRINWGKIDAIYVWEVSPVTMAIPAIKLSKKYNKPLLLYCMDIWPECIKAMGFKEGSLFYKVIHHISRKIYQKCDHIAVSSKPFFNYLETVNGCRSEKMSYLPQFASSRMLGEDYTKTPNGHVNFLYIGNIGKAQNMPCLIKAIALLKNREDVTFHFIGGGSELENTIKLAQDIGADAVIKFYGPKPFDEAVEYYKIADACILSLDGSNHIGDTLPGKLQTYMAAGKPVIGAMNGAGKQVIYESSAGICVDAGDYKALSKAFLDYIKHPDVYKGCGANARKYFLENFTEKKHFDDLEKILQELINQ